MFVFQPVNITIYRDAILQIQVSGAGYEARLFDGTRNSTAFSALPGSGVAAASQLGSACYVFRSGGSSQIIAHSVSREGTYTAVNTLSGRTFADSSNISSDGSEIFFWGVSDGTATPTNAKFNGSTVSTITTFGAFRWASASAISSDTYIFGGTNSSGTAGINQIHKWNGTPSLTAASLPALGQYYQRSACTTLSSTCWIFGGYSYTVGTYGTNIWSFNGTTTSDAYVSLGGESYSASASVLSNLVHVMGGATNGGSWTGTNAIRTWDGSTRVTLSLTNSGSAQGYNSAASFSGGSAGTK